MENRLNHTRLAENLEEMGRVGVGKGGLRNRLALSDADREARDLLCGWIGDAGLELKIDAIGNIWGLLPGTENGDPVTMGSHIDTVRDAGMFDGCVGVLSALECLRTVAERRIPHRKSLALAAFTNEEGARFHPDMMGSLVVAGRAAAEEMYGSADDDGRTVGGELERIGYKGSDRVRPSFYLEYHIEQGPFLDQQKLPFAVVTGIPGISWWSARYVGEANHAGSTPMNMRRDALLALSRLHCRMTEIAVQKGACLTIGRVRLQPDVTNIIPGAVDFTVDMRCPEQKTFEWLKEALKRTMCEIADASGLSLEWRQTVNGDAVAFAPEMVNLVERCLRARGFQAPRMCSGACHDAQMMNGLVPTAMLFVASRDGKSHCPQEFSDMKQICDGAEVMLDCLLELAR